MEKTEKEKKEFLISVLKIHSDQADSYYANKTAKGKWEIGTSNDYPMQHGDGHKFLLTDKLVESFMDASKLKHNFSISDESLNSLFAEIRMSSPNEDNNSYFRNIVHSLLPVSPNVSKVEDWDEVMEKYLQSNSQEMFFDWAKQHYSLPVSPTDEGIRTMLDPLYLDEGTIIEIIKGIRSLFSFQAKSKVEPVPNVEKKEEWSKVISVLEDCFKNGNEQCDGGWCMGCWKDKVREAIKLLSSPPPPKQEDAGN